MGWPCPFTNPLGKVSALVTHVKHVALFPGLSTIQVLVNYDYSMQKWRRGLGAFYHVNDISVDRVGRGLQWPTCVITSRTRAGVKLYQHAIENVWGFCTSPDQHC